MGLKAVGLDQDHRQDIGTTTRPRERSCQGIVGAYAQRGGRMGPLHSEREGCHPRAYAIVSTRRRAQGGVRRRSPHWSHLARCENDEKFKLQETTLSWKYGLKEKRNRGEQKYSGLGNWAEAGSIEESVNLGGGGVREQV